jgi:hypothetical protein
MDHEVLNCPRMIGKVEKMNMRQEKYETNQETKDMIEPQKESETITIDERNPKRSQIYQLIRGLKEKGT